MERKKQGRALEERFSYVIERLTARPGIAW